MDAEFRAERKNLFATWGCTATFPTCLPPEVSCPPTREGEQMFKFNKLRSLWAKTRNAQRATSRDPQDAQRNDEGFSFAQVIVTMVIVGILGGAIGFTAFQFIGQSRETVLAANIRTAADAVQNTLALNPDLKAAAATTGVPDPSLLSELGNAAGFTWNGSAFPFAATDGVETVRIQMIEKGAATGVPNDTDAPKVGWLVASQDAVRLQIRNDDGAWACALIVLRPNWTAALAGSGATTGPDDEAGAEGNLRGIWYDAGSNTPADNGLHHCSPTAVTTLAVNRNYGIGSTITGKAPLPNSGSQWTIPHDTSPGASVVDDKTSAATVVVAVGRLLERSVPDFAAN